MKTQLKKELDYVDATRKKRMAMAQRVLGDPEWFPALLELALEEHNTTGSRAAWVLEFVFRERPSLLYPLLDDFTRGLHKVVPEPSIRSLAKICEMLLSSHYESGDRPDRPPLTREHKEAMTAACFDWLMGTKKVAPKAYSMHALLLLGAEAGWVHPQLKGILEQNYAQGSPAYQARARQVLRKLS